MAVETQRVAVTAKPRVRRQGKMRKWVLNFLRHLLFFFMQKVFVQGITLTGIKG